jgi:hypothetical protein
MWVPMTYTKIPVETSLLRNPTSEELDTRRYWIEASASLFNFAIEDPELSQMPICAQLAALMTFWRTENPQATAQSLEDAALDLSYFGPVGKALWYLPDKSDPQFRKEIKRFATDPPNAIGTHYLFYIVGTLASHGYQVGFVPEAGKASRKTPDLWAEKDGQRTWIEANAKQPKRPIDSPEKVWQLIRDIITEKKQKFSEPIFAPGLIVADVSPIADQINRGGTLGSAPLVRTRSDCCEPLPLNGFICRLYQDVEWSSRPENRDNIFAFLVQEFAAIDRQKHNVEQCLVTVSRRVVRVGNNLAFPRQHQLVITRNAEKQALSELSRFIYVV